MSHFRLDYKKIGKTKCLFCGKQYQPQHKKTKYCSPECHYESNVKSNSRMIDKSGYVLVKHRDNPRRWIREHRQIMEVSLGRELLRTELVHHINGIKNDNRLENLVITNMSEHISHHNSGIKFTLEHRKKISKALSRNNNRKRNY
jgi:hypothetical protein